MDDPTVKIRDMDHLLASLIERRGQMYEHCTCAQQQGEAVLMLARDQGRHRLEPREDNEFCQCMDEMRTLGAQIVGLDEQIECLRGLIEEEISPDD